MSVPFSSASQAAKEAATSTMAATAAAPGVDGHQQEAQPQHEIRQDAVVTGEEAVPSAETPLRAEVLVNEESTAAAGSPSIGTSAAAAAEEEEMVDEQQQQETSQQRQETPADRWVPLPTDSFPRDHLLLANDVERAIAERLSSMETLDIESVEAFAERLSSSEQQQLSASVPVESAPVFISSAAAEAAPVAFESTSVAADVSELASSAGATPSSSSSDLTEIPLEEWSPEEVSVSVVQPLDLDELVQEEFVAMVQDVAQSIDEEDINEEIALIEDEAAASRQQALPEVSDAPSDPAVLDSGASLEMEETRKKKVAASEAA